MPFILADEHGWREPFEPVVLNTFEKLREAVNNGGADFFMWEHFTSKRYYDSGEIRKIGEIYPPWPSWQIVARDATDLRLEEMGSAINKGIAYFKENQKEAVEYISTELAYSVEDATDWLATVQFPSDVRAVEAGAIHHALELLDKAGVLDSNAELKPEEIIRLFIPENVRKAKNYMH